MSQSYSAKSAKSAGSSKSRMIKLTPKNIQKIIQNREKCCILAYMQTCPYSIALKATLSKCKTTIPIYILHDVDEASLGPMLKIVGNGAYPRLYQGMVGGRMSQYKGDRSIDSLTSWMTK